MPASRQQMPPQAKYVGVQSVLCPMSTGPSYRGLDIMDLSRVDRRRREAIVDREHGNAVGCGRLQTRLRIVGFVAASPASPVQVDHRRNLPLTLGPVEVELEGSPISFGIGDVGEKCH